MSKGPSRISRLARGTSGEVVDFAQRQVFSPSDEIGVPAGVPRRSLQAVFCELIDSEINAGLQTFASDSFRVWIGDELNGFVATAEIMPKDPAWSDDGAVAHWLHETAIRLYPNSDYARKHRAG